MEEPLEVLELRQRKLYQQLEAVGDFRRGTISVNYRKCGKDNCACARAGHPGHGPQYLLMTKVGGQSRAKNLRPGPELQRIQQEVANHQRFRELVQQIVELNERICQARPGDAPSESLEVATLKKKLCRPSKQKSRGK